MMRAAHFMAVAVTFIFAAPCAATVGDLGRRPQGAEQLEQLRRDQAAILRKAERLREVMQRLLSRYRREDREAQAKLLEQGLQHLEQVGLLKDVASVRNDLVADAFRSAVRRQEEVIAELEQLLDILMERPSARDLENKIEETTALLERARALRQRQTALRNATQQAQRTPASGAEQLLLDLLAALSRQQRNEADHNERVAGDRVPFLEEALHRIRDLLRRQEDLEKAADRQLAGQPNPSRELAFRIGDLQRRVQDLLAEQRRNRDLQRLEEQARELSEALDGADPAKVQKAKESLELGLRRAAQVRDERDSGRPQLAELAGELARLSSDAEGKQAIKALANAAEKARAAIAAERRTAVAAARRALQKAVQDARDVAQNLPSRPDEAPAAGTPADAARKAADALEKAAAGETPAREQAEQLAAALRALETARARLRDQNPDAAARADRMAADADRTARDLRNAPRAQAEEQAASAALDEAHKALRESARQLESTEQTEREKVTEALSTARRGLERALELVQKALQAQTGDQAQDMKAAADRQQELTRQAQQARGQLDRERQQGNISQQQQQRAGEQLDRAGQAMQEAEQALQQGQRSTGAARQQEAADALDSAQQALDQNRAMSVAEKADLERLQREQKELEEEILRLAKILKEQDKERAKNALEDASDASRRARQSMTEADRQQTDQQQQRAEEKLEEAAEALEEERDRYLDLRQEELLFRMQQELEEFLDKQRPLTRATAEARNSLASGARLTRPLRRRLNLQGEQEKELAERLGTIRNALQEEQNRVFEFVLRSNQEDLENVSERLAGRRPDPGEFTGMLQRDVERRTEDLIAALERKRREQQEQQQQQQQGENKFNPQREALVSMIAELKMLKALEEDARRRMEEMQMVLDGLADGITEVEAHLIERLAHRHNEITTLFLQLKTQIEQAIQQPGDEEGDGGRDR